MRHPLKQIYITQRFGENPEMYKKYGLLGHNGTDFRAPNGTPVYAPHAGVIKEKHNDINGYGKYIKIQNDKEGSVLAHFKDWAVNINQHVQAGQLVGYADNTGFSTGPHLHWGYFPLPRDRKNGYNGYVNQLPLLDKDMPEYFDPLIREDLGLDRTKPEGDVRGRVGAIKNILDKHGENKTTIANLRSQLKATNEILADKALELSSLQTKIENEEAKTETLETELIEKRALLFKANGDVKVLTVQVGALKKEVGILQDGIKDQKEKVKALKVELRQSKKELVEGLSFWQRLKLLFKG